MFRTREAAAELARVARTLTMRSASSEELQNTLVFLIDAYIRLAQDLEESNISWASGLPHATDQDASSELPKGS